MKDVSGQHRSLDLIGDFAILDVPAGVATTLNSQLAGLLVCAPCTEFTRSPSRAKPMLLEEYPLGLIKTQLRLSLLERCERKRTVFLFLERVF